MRFPLALLVAACFALPATARAATVFGVTEDAGKYSSDGGAAFFARLHDLGMTENAVSVQWDPDRPTTIVERALLDRLVPTAAHNGIRLVFSVYFTRPTALSSRPGAAAEFAAFLRTLARAYPGVTDFVVGNEPNYGVFWQPQFESDGRPAAGTAYEDVLARGYDALKSVDPRINVIGLGLAARGNDDPGAGSPSTSPVLFLRDVGNAYRRSGRTRPLMDSLAYHPYPASSLDTVVTRQSWPSAGVADLGRVKQTVWDAFHDTAQATFETGLALRITEIGWQAAIPSSELGSYRGAENVRTTDESTQARIYGQLVHALACDPAVTDVLFFHLIDETDLTGFQSGLVRADGSPRPAYRTVQKAIADSGGRCSGSPVAWSHAVDVVGAGVSFGRPGEAAPFAASAAEGAVYRAAVVRVEGTPTEAEAAEIRRTLEGGGPGVVSGTVPAGGRVEPSLEIPTPAGSYVQAVLLTALTDPSRGSFSLGEPFSVGAPGDDGAQAAAVPSPGAGTPQIRTAEAEAPAAIPATRPASAAGGAGPNGTVGFRLKPRVRAVEVQARAEFRKPRAESGTTPLSPGVTASDREPPPQRSAEPRAGGSVDSREPKKTLPTLFALLLAGSALSAVLAVRLLGR